MPDREKIRKYFTQINVEYDSPIRLYYQTVDNIMNQVKGSCDQAVYQAVCNVGVNIDKDKLEQAIHQDRQRYDEAYRRGYAKAQEDIVRCKDCRHYDPDEYAPGSGDCLGACDNLVKVHENWFCADGERRSEDA